MNKKPAFANTIVLALVVGACIAGYTLYFVVQLTTPIPPQYVEDLDNWPEPLQALCDSNTALHQSARVYKYDAWVNRKSAWIINGHSDSITDLVTSQSLETTNAEHPRVKDLLELIPDEWPTPDLNASDFYATTEYGYEHLEGAELLLVVRDDATDTTFVLNKWIF